MAVSKHRLLTKPSDLMDAPWIKARLSRKGVEDHYFSQKYDHSATIDFPALFFLLGFFSKGLRQVGGNPELGKALLEAARNRDLERVQQLTQQFPQDKPLVIQFPWVNAYTNIAQRTNLALLWGTETVNKVFEALKGNLSHSFGEPWSAVQEARTRCTFALSWSTAHTWTSMKLQTMDAWFPKINQGFNIDGSTRKMLDLSPESIGDEGLALLRLRDCAFYPGRKGLSCRYERPELTLLGNLFYNLGTDYVMTNIADVRQWHNNKAFFEGVTSNLPKAAFMGCQGVVIEGSPAITLHNTPRNAYNEIKRRAEYGAQLRWTGIHVAPSSSADSTGTAANLQLVGRKTNTSRFRRNRNYLLYDRDTVENLKDALSLHPAVLETHDMLDAYLDWYHERRDDAARYFKSQKGDFKPGRWGFEPFAFAGVPATAKLYMKWEG